jgi:hypothetical protein
MPRPSDVYATLGAPGVYPATPCTPSQLPDVYLFPPEEDDEDVHCLFRSGSASPATFESFFRYPVYSQRDTHNPTFTDLRAFDHALSYFQRQSAARSGGRCGLGSSWEHKEGIQGISRNYPLSTVSSASSRSSLSDSFRGSSEVEGETTIYSNTRYLIEPNGPHEEQWQDQHQHPSRRSSIFGDRPPDYETLQSRAREDLPVLKKSQTMSLRARAAMALKGWSGATPRRLGHAPDVLERRGGEGADAEPAVHESWFEPKRLLRRRSRRILAQLPDSQVDAHSIAGDVNLEVAPAALSSSVRDPKLLERKSVTQLFGVGRASVENATKVHNDQPRLGLSHPAARSSSSLVTPTGASKLSRRRSMTQLFGLRRGASSTGLSDHTIVAVDPDGTSTGIHDTSLDVSSQALEESHTIPATVCVSMTCPASAKSDSSASPATSGKTAQPGRPKSFLGKGGFSFLDLHRRFAPDHTSRSHSQAQHTPPVAPAVDPAAQFSPDSLSERTDSSSSVAPSTECDQMIEDDMRLSESYIPAIVQQGGEALAKSLEPNLLPSRTQIDFNQDLTPSFGLDNPDDDVESEISDDPPALELAGLDSLSFDQLVFDPDSFSGAIYD